MRFFTTICRRGPGLQPPAALSGHSTPPGRLPPPSAVLRAEYGEVSAVARRVKPAGLAA